LNFLSVKKSTEGLFASSVFGKTDYIPLEETNNSLLGDSQIKFVDNNIIIIAFDSQLYLFSSDGRFLNRIGKKGNGPEEYLHPSGVFKEKNDSLLRVVDSNAKRIIWYKTDGTFVRNSKFLKVKDKPFEYSYLDSNYILVSYRQENKNGDGVYDELQVINKSGDILFFYKDKPSKGAAKISFFCYPYVQFDSNNFFVSLPFNDTIFSIDIKNKKFSPFAIEYRGSRQMPREMAEDFKLSKQNRNAHYTQLWSVIASRYIFSRFYFENSVCFTVFDTMKSRFIGYNEVDFEDLAISMVNWGIKDDINNKKVGVFPEYVSENKVYDLIYPDKLNDKNFNNNPVLFVGTLLN